MLKEPRTQDLFINRKHKFLLFWNRKCACTSVAVWFFDNLDLPESVTAAIEDPDSKRRYLRSHSEYCITFDEVRYYKDYTKIIVVRNPWDRIVSTYLDIFCNRDRFKRLDRLVQGVVAQIYKRSTTRATEYKGISFGELIKFIKERKRQNRFLDRHLNLQSHGLENICFDIICKVELIDREIGILNRRFGFKHNIGKYYATVYDKDSANNKNYANISSLILSGFSKKPLPKCFYSQKLFDKVRKIYSKDIEMFGYTDIDYKKYMSQVI